MIGVIVILSPFIVIFLIGGIMYEEIKKYICQKRKVKNIKILSCDGKYPTSYHCKYNAESSDYIDKGFKY